MVTGSVYPELEKTLPQFPNKTPRVVFRNLGNGTFEELLDGAGPGVAGTHCSRGCAFGDFDNDGDLDALIVNSERASLSFAQRCARLEPLAEASAHRHEIESQRDRRESGDPLRKKPTSAGIAQPIELLFNK